MKEEKYIYIYILVVVFAWQRWTDIFKIACWKNIAEKEIFQYCLFVGYSYFYTKQGKVFKAAMFDEVIYSRFPNIRANLS